MSTGFCDYHVHYFVDGCVHEEMTLANIEREALRLGLAEISVLKHYSQELPNGKSAWVNWKKIIPEQFEAFLEDILTFRKNARLSMLAGVETELVDDSGKVNIPPENAGKLDMLNLSVHWLPDMDVLRADPTLDPWHPDKTPPAALADWQQRVRECDPAAVVENFIHAYRRAIKTNPKVRVLAHMGDGLDPLRTYGIEVDALPDAHLCALVEPLMTACVRSEVLWELLPTPVKRPAILKRANDLGVRFTATADAHFLQADGWSHLRDHAKAEVYIASLGLAKGTIKKVP